ncbi:rhomboid family intramembrane serine protease [Candidatus Micrarchaeota archaeon]|nr:rhomboid family intramembrane serine protease [Candidatus Micrarchaeota archaeon]
MDMLNSQKILFVIIAVFLLQILMPGITEEFYLDPSTVLQKPWTIVTSMFLHGGLTHLFFNGYALFLFGLILERKIGGNEFIKLYFASGIIAGLVYVLTVFLGAPAIPALGASGAIYGVLGAVAVLRPDMKIFFFFFPMKMKYAAVLWVIIEFLGTFNPYSGIASAAHLGGLVAGLVYAYFLKKRINPPMPVAYYVPRDPYEQYY